MIGVKPYGYFYPLPPKGDWSQTRMQDQFDAVLYLGPPSSMTTSAFPLALCDDADYMRMRLHRLLLDTGPIGGPAHAALQALCANDSKPR